MLRARRRGSVTVSGKPLRFARENAIQSAAGVSSAWTGTGRPPDRFRMSNPLLRFLGGGFAARRAVELIQPRRTFDDVILNPATRRALDQALTQVTSHDLIFNRWGLGE